MFENQNIEFKKIWKDEWLEWICGFCNTTGGTMYIGADDDGKIIGLGNKAGDLLDKLPGKIRDSLGIIVEVVLKKENNLEYIIINIDKYPIPISYHGKFYLRSGRSNHEATEAEYKKKVKNILFEKHPSVPRNLLISQTFFRAGFVEYWGSGIKRITDACEQYGSPIPEIVNEAGGVAVKCSPSQSYIKAMKGEKEKTTDQVPTKFTDQVPTKFTDQVEKILQFCNEPRSKVEIMEYLNYKHKRNFTEIYLKPLLEQGKLRMTIPDKPKSSKQRYIISNK